MNITPAMTAMRVIARSVDAIYLRLPEEFRRPFGEGGCSCDHCKKGPVGNWDTLVVPTRLCKYDHTHTVHMPDGAIQPFKDHRSINNDPEIVPMAVIKAVIKAWPDQAVEILTDLRFAGDHYSFNRWNMYVGVEFDGHIHT